MEETIVFANWKMNKTQKEVSEWVRDFADSISKKDLKNLAGINLKQGNFKPVTIFLAPPLPYSNFLSTTIGYSHLSSILKLAAQNVSEYEKGSYTGEISAFQLQDIGVLAVLVGHSERRINLDETDRSVAKKALLCLKYHLLPIVCISKIAEVIGLKTEILTPTPLPSFEPSQSQEPKSPPTTPLPNPNPSPADIFKKMVIAFEPLSAIGSDQPDTAEDTQKMALEIKQILGQDTKVLYGGSVNSQNCAAFLGQPDINGLLVGTASLDAKEFAKIIEQTACLNSKFEYRNSEQ